MRRNYINKLFWLLPVLLLLAACNAPEKKQGHHHDDAATVKEFTCPMHPEIVRTVPGKCPICGMELVPRHVPGTETTIDSTLSHLIKPVNEQVIASIDTIRVTAGMEITPVNIQGIVNYDMRNQRLIASRVAGRIEKLYIKYNYQPVKKGQLIMEIYSPDLAAAQRELLFINNQNPGSDLLSRSKQRLQLLGLSPATIENILKTDKIVYNIPVYSQVNGFIKEINAPLAVEPLLAAAPASGDGMNGMGGGGNNSTAMSVANAATTSPVLLLEGQYVNAGQSVFTVMDNRQLVAEFYLPPAITPYVKKDQSLLFYTIDDAQKMFNEKIGLIQPMFTKGYNFTLARVYLNNPQIIPGQMITANLPLISKGKWLPQKAIVTSGNRSIVFKKEQQVFVPKYVRTGFNAAGMIEVLDDIDNWTIAANAAYMVDSESFIKTSEQ